MANSTDKSLVAIEKSTIHKVSTHIVPFVALMFFVNFLDRTAIGYASPHGMNEYLGLSAAQYGFASGIFFVGYIILEIPSNLALHKVGARKWLSRIMITWGIVAVLFTWVQTPTQLYWLRFLLGVMEAGFFPGAILFLSLWTPARHRGRILGLFYLAQPLTTAIGAPLAGGLIQLHGLFGLDGWRVMFLFVGVPAVILGVLTPFVLRDHPGEASWLNPDEKKWLIATLKAEEEATEKVHKIGLGEMFRNGRVWGLAFVYFGFIYGLYALSFFLPTIVNGFDEQLGGISASVEGVITGAPYFVAAAVLFFWSRMVQKQGMKTWHVALPAFVGAVSIPLALFVQDKPLVTMIFVVLTACSIFAVLPNFWTLPTQFLTGAAAAGGTALINTLGNIAGFSAGYITGWLYDLTGAYLVPMIVVGGFMALSGIMLILLKASGSEAEKPDAVVTPLESKALVNSGK